MTIIKTIKVIAVVIGGVEAYVVTPSCMFPDPTTTNLLDAFDYSKDDKLLERDLGRLVVPDDTFFAKSGLRIDALPVVKEFNILAEEISSKIGREAY